MVGKGSVVCRRWSSSEGDQAQRTRHAARGAAKKVEPAAQPYAWSLSEVESVAGYNMEYRESTSRIRRRASPRVPRVDKRSGTRPASLQQAHTTPLRARHRAEERHGHSENIRRREVPSEVAAPGS